MRDVPFSARVPVPVWDLPLRLFHWTLLAAVAVAGITGFLLPLNWLNLHLIAGTAIAVLLLLRLVWGFTGTAYSRFASFAFAPSAIVAYVRELLDGRPKHYTGHNPLGSVMIFALLATLASLVATGVITLGGAEKQGPLKAMFSYASGIAAKQLHELAAYGLLLLIAGHVAGIIIESGRSGESLPRSMVTGIKSAEPPVDPTQARPTAAILGILLVALVIGLPMLVLWRQTPRGVPVQAMDQGYEKDCGDCHIPFHPSLRGKQSWARIMATLDDHFGEDASLGADAAARIGAYLDANAAEHWDTRAANVFRAAEPLRMTEARFWLSRHADIDPSVFKSKKAGTKSNCEACHGDARQGLFTPQAINIPKE